MSNPQILLLGNGLNRCFKDVSWGEMIKEVMHDMRSKLKYEDIESLPFPMQIVAATGDRVNDAMKIMSAKLLIDKICDEQRDLLTGYLALPFDEIVTTNYTFEIEQALGCPARTGMYRNHVHYTKKCTDREKISGLYKYFEVDNRRVWHIHGDVNAPNSIIIGQYYYGKTLCDFKDYIVKLLRRYNANHESFKPQIWLDYFMTGDVHISGFALDMSEIDIWWLIACKQRNMPDTKLYFYYPSFEEERKENTLFLLKLYGVETIPISTNEYIEFHKKAVGAINAVIEKNVNNR